MMLCRKRDDERAKHWQRKKVRLQPPKCRSLRSTEADVHSGDTHSTILCGSDSNCNIESVLVGCRLLISCWANSRQMSFHRNFMYTFDDTRKKCQLRFFSDFRRRDMNCADRDTTTSWRIALRREIADIAGPPRSHTLQSGIDVNQQYAYANTDAARLVLY